MSAGMVTVTVEGNIAIMTLARPEKLNALDLPMLGELVRAADAVEANPEVRVVILTGAGKGFCAGGDIRAWADMTPQAFGHDWVRYGHRVFERLATLRMPVIAALNGHALGGGLELAGVADIRIAEAHIRIGLPETGLGMVPGWSGTQRLVHRFGARMVRRMALGGEVFNAEEACRMGLVDSVVPSGEAVSAAMEYARRIASRGPAATEITKLMLAVASGEDNGAAVEALGSILVAKTGDLRQGIEAFSARRPAAFKGEW